MTEEARFKSLEDQLKKQDKKIEEFMEALQQKMENFTQKNNEKMESFMLGIENKFSAFMKLMNIDMDVEKQAVELRTLGTSCSMLSTEKVLTINNEELQMLSMGILNTKVPTNNSLTFKYQEALLSQSNCNEKSIFGNEIVLEGVEHDVFDKISLWSNSCIGYKEMDTTNHNFDNLNKNKEPLKISMGPVEKSDAGGRIKALLTYYEAFSSTGKSFQEVTGIYQEFQERVGGESLMTKTMFNHSIIKNVKNLEVINESHGMILNGWSSELLKGAFHWGGSNSLPKFNAKYYGFTASSEFPKQRLVGLTCGFHQYHVLYPIPQNDWLVMKHNQKGKNMRTLKLQTWEMKFFSRIQDTEVGWLRKYLYTLEMSSFIFSVAPSFWFAVTMGACILMGIPLELGKILSALATFRALHEPIYELSTAISMTIETKFSLDGIVSFLPLDDLPRDIIEKLPRGSSDTAIEIVDENFTWAVSFSSSSLRSININISHGMRVTISGAVVVGKSSLLSCILGEMPKVSGSIKLCGTKAYVARSAWIQSNKIEENILFCKEMEKEKYDSLFKACSLKKDLEILPFGDRTIIGEKGINLSGGQKQRIQIAHASYHDADIFVFDDSFSALDTGAHLLNECILGFQSSKTAVYVTHQVKLLPAADLILVMKDGKVTQAGKYNGILKLGGDSISA